MPVDIDRWTSDFDVHIPKELNLILQVWEGTKPIEILKMYLINTCFKQIIFGIPNNKCVIEFWIPRIAKYDNVVVRITGL